MKHLLILLIVGFLFSFKPTIVDAHVSQSSGNFIGELHADPEETPTAQANVTLMFTINDKNQKFEISNCDCEVTIAVPGKLPYTQKITTPAAATGGMYSVMVPFVFPRGGMYDISFAGKPTTSNAFEPFNLQWEFKVKSASNEIQTLKTPKEKTQSYIIPLVITAFFVLFIFGGVFLYKKRRK